MNGLNYAMTKQQRTGVDVIVKNSLSLGGVNMSVVFKRYEDDKADESLKAQFKKAVEGN